MYALVSFRLQDVQWTPAHCQKSGFNRIWIGFQHLNHVLSTTWFCFPLNFSNKKGVLLYLSYIRKSNYYSYLSLALLQHLTIESFVPQSLTFTISEYHQGWRLGNPKDSRALSFNPNISCARWASLISLLCVSAHV